MNNYILLLHLLAAIFWLGGMMTLHFCVRSAAVSVLSAPQPLVLMHATLARFLRLVAWSILLLLLTGIHLYGMRGGLAARWGIHVMALGGLVMMLIYAHIRFATFKQLDQAVTASKWSDAKAALERIRVLVGINLTLGIVITCAVKIGG